MPGHTMPLPRFNVTAPVSQTSGSIWSFYWRWRRCWWSLGRGLCGVLSPGRPPRSHQRSGSANGRLGARRVRAMWARRGYCIDVGNVEQVYSALVKRSPDAERELNVGDRRHLAGNGLRLVTASAMQSSGDQTVNASTVLPWLFHALGVPPALISVLVPIREAGSMLPQALLTPLVLKFEHRKWVFVAGAVVQAVSVGAMATTAAFGGGLVAGLIIVLALATFSLGRCLCSISSKDVQ